MLSKVFRNSFWYSFSSILLRASSVIFFPIFSSYLTKADYGILSISQSLILSISIIAGLELKSSLSRFINSDEAKESKTYQSKIIGNVLTASIISHTIVIIICLIIGKYAFKSILNDIDFYPYIFFTLIGLFFTFIVNLYRVYLKAIHKGKESFIYDIAYFSSNIGLNLLFVVVLKTDVIGIIYSTVICGVVFSTISLLQFRKLCSFSLDKNILLPIFKYTIPLIPYIWLGLGIEFISTFFLNLKIGKEASGLFYIAVTFAGIFSIVKESIISAITPWFFEFYKTEKKLIHKLVHHVLWGGAIICFIISVFSFEVLHILSNNANLVEGWKYIPTLIIGYLIVFVGQIYILPIYYKRDKNNFLIIGSLLGFLTTFFIAYLLTDQMGVMGAVIAKTAGYTVMTIIFLIISKIVINFDINFYKIGLILIVIIPLLYLNYLPFNYVYMLIIKISLSFALTIHFIYSLTINYFGFRRKIVVLKKTMQIKKV